MSTDCWPRAVAPRAVDRRRVGSDGGRCRDVVGVADPGGYPAGGPGRGPPTPCTSAWSGGGTVGRAGRRWVRGWGDHRCAVAGGQHRHPPLPRQRRRCSCWACPASWPGRRSSGCSPSSRSSCTDAAGCRPGAGGVIGDEAQVWARPAAVADGARPTGQRRPRHGAGHVSAGHASAGNDGAAATARALTARAAGGVRSWCGVRRRCRRGTAAMVGWRVRRCGGGSWSRRCGGRAGGPPRADPRTRPAGCCATGCSTSRPGRGCWRGGGGRRARTPATSGCCGRPRRPGTTSGSPTGSSGRSRRGSGGTAAAWTGSPPRSMWPAPPRS